MTLKPLHDLATIERVDIATYQAVSGAGKKGIDQLQQELSSDNLNRTDKTIPIAFNVVPAIDVFLSSGFTKEEMKLHEETQKILACTDLLVNATAVRVPVWQGHSEAVHLRTQQPFTLDAASTAISQFPGVRYCDQEIPTAVTHAHDNHDVWVGRLRRHPSDSAHYVNFWVVSDNLYKGAAWNALQIAMSLF
jgi:aspartate-semialdehyde dehydrogenase